MCRYHVQKLETKSDLREMNTAPKLLIHNEMIYVIATINVRYRVRRCFSEILGQQRFLTHAITFKLTEIVTILSRTSWIVGMDINKPNSNAN